MTKISPDADHCSASYPHENRVALVVGYQLSFTNDEEVLTGSFGEMSSAVQKQPFVETAFQSITHGEDRVEILTARFCRCRHHVCMKLLPRRDCDPHTFFESDGSEIRRPGPGKYDDFNRTLRGMHAETTASEVTERPQITTFEFVQANQFLDCFYQLHTPVRDFETVNLR